MPPTSLGHILKQREQFARIRPSGLSELEMTCTYGPGEDTPADGSAARSSGARAVSGPAGSNAMSPSRTRRHRPPRHRQRLPHQIRPLSRGLRPADGSSRMPPRPPFGLYRVEEAAASAEPSSTGGRARMTMGGPARQPDGQGIKNPLSTSGSCSALAPRSASNSTPDLRETLSVSSGEANGLQLQTMRIKYSQWFTSFVR